MSTITLTPATTTAFESGVPQWRLTRRGRLVVFLVAMLSVLAIAVTFGASSMATDETGTPEQTELVMIGEGETLWQIASERAEDGDVRSMMRTIEELNALDSSMLMVGPEIHVPIHD